MKKLSVLLCALCLTAGLANAAGNTFAVQVGQKGLDTDDWDPIDKQMMFGVHYDMPLGAMPFNLAFDALMSMGSDEVNSVDVEGSTTELMVGARKYFDLGIKPQLYAGLGLGLMMGNVTVEDADYDESGTGFGFAVDGGVLFPLNETWKLGLDLRYSSGNVSIDDEDVAGGGFAYSLVVAMGL